jgi:hypothetical protein
MSKPLAANETRRQLRYNYTAAEHIAKAQAMAEAFTRFTITEAELSRVKKDYGARLDAIQSEIDLLREAVASGYELRDYLCFWEYDQPRLGRKLLRKREGGEAVAEEDMTERDRQLVMEILDAEAARASAPAPAGEKLPLPAPKLWPEHPTEVALSKADALAGMADGPLVIREEDALAYADWFFSTFCDAETNDLRPKDEAEEWLDGILDAEITGEIETFLQWLLTTPAVQDMPRSEYVITKTRAHLADRAETLRKSMEAAKAEAAAKKKAARSGRRASASGTVEVPADEGSRDDAGPDSKTNL